MTKLTVDEPAMEQEGKRPKEQTCLYYAFLLRGTTVVVLQAKDQTGLGNKKMQ